MRAHDNFLCIKNISFCNCGIIFLLVSMLNYSTEESIVFMNVCVVNVRGERKRVKKEPAAKQQPIKNINQSTNSTPIA